MTLTLGKIDVRESGIYDSVVGCESWFWHIHYITDLTTSQIGKGDTKKTQKSNFFGHKTTIPVILAGVVLRVKRFWIEE